eukprot:3309553-Alexandrium_andersonii.AAC.1
MDTSRGDVDTERAGLERNSHGNPWIVRRQQGTLRSSPGCRPPRVRSGQLVGLGGWRRARQ